MKKTILLFILAIVILGCHRTTQNVEGIKRGDFIFDKLTGEKLIVVDLCYDYVYARKDHEQYRYNYFEVTKESKNK